MIIADKKRLSVRAGFTLLELLAVITIISILLGLLVSGITVAQKKAKIYQAESMIASLASAVAMYHVDFGAYPDSGNQNLVNVLADFSTYGSNPDWKGPYISFKDKDLNGIIPNATLKDSWNRSYNYTRQSNPPYYEIWSDGPNGVDEAGSGDDIKSW